MYVNLKFYINIGYMLNHRNKNSFQTSKKIINKHCIPRKILEASQMFCITKPSCCTDIITPSTILLLFTIKYKDLCIKRFILSFIQKVL